MKDMITKAIEVSSISRVTACSPATPKMLRDQLLKTTDALDAAAHTLIIADATINKLAKLAGLDDSQLEQLTDILGAPTSVKRQSGRYPWKDGKANV